MKYVAKVGDLYLKNLDWQGFTLTPDIKEAIVFHEDCDGARSERDMVEVVVPSLKPVKWVETE